VPEAGRAALRSTGDRPPDYPPEP
ncbi:uncharacterized protein METZ01_LOCUS130735, partial [marine metagenome]